MVADLDDLLATEQRALGAAMLADPTIGPATCWLAPGNFRLRRHATVFESIRAIDRRGGFVTAVAVAEDLQDRGLLAVVGGPMALHALVSASVGARASDVDFLLKHTPVDPGSERA